MRSFYKRIEVPIYSKWIHICAYKDTKYAEKTLLRRDIKVDLIPADFDAGAISIMDFSDPNFGGVIIFTHDEITYGTIAHEVDHIVHDLLKYVGMKRTNSSEEAYSYLQEYLVQQISILIKAKGIRIKD